MKKIFLLCVSLVLSLQVARADFAQHYNAGQAYLTQYQYSSAITEFKRALRINYMDNSARIGLINAYLARGTYFANNDKNWDAAANDFRAALFYMQYYADDEKAQNSSQAIKNATNNLNQCLSVLGFNKTPSNRYKKAVELRADGKFAEAGYEFSQVLGDAKLKADALEQLADIMKIVGNAQKAAKYYKKAVEINDSDSNLRLKYARVLERLDQPDLAVEEYNFALAKSNNDPEILYSLERIYRKKLQANPNQSEVLCSLGAILQKRNHFDEALKYYSKASKLDPSSVLTRLNVGTLYQQKKSYDSAIAAYDSILILYPDNVQANLYKAQCLAKKGQNKEALSAFKKVLQLDPTNKDVKFEILSVLKNTMTPAEMAQYLKINSPSGNAAEDMYAYALELHKKHKYNDAIASYKEVLRMKPNNEEAYINLAIAYKQNREVEKAITVLTNADRKFPASKLVKQNLSAFADELAQAKIAQAAKYFNSGNYKNALELYKQINPPTFESLSGMAVCYKSMDDLKNSVESYRKALALQPKNSEVAYYVGVLYSELEDWTSAKKYLQQSIALDSKNQNAKDLYDSIVEQDNIKLVDQAIELYDAGRYDQSMQLVNRILLEDAKNSYAYYYRGLIYDVKNKYNLAIADYKNALKFNPSLTIIYYLLALDYDNLTKYKDALANYKKYVSQEKEQNEYKSYSKARIEELKQYE